MWMTVGYAVGYFINYLVVAGPLRRYTKKVGLLSLPEFFEHRYGDNKRSGKLLRTLAAIFITIFFVGYIGAQLTAAGKAFNVLMQVPYAKAVLIAAFFGTFYALFGGYKAVVWTDTVQGVLMLLVLVVLPLYLIVNMGGWNVFFSKAAAIDPILVMPLAGIKGWGGIAFVIGLAFGGLAEPGQPHILARFISARSDKVILGSSIVGMFWVLVVQTGSNLLGLIGRIMHPTNIADPEFILPTIIAEVMPAIMSGIVLAAIFAAILSTVDSLIICAAQAIHLDIIENVFKKKLEGKEEVRWGRIIVLLLGIGGTIVALSNVRIVFWFVLYAWSAMGAGFGPLVILGLYWKKATYQGALAGMLTGVATTVIWYNIPMLKNFVYELVPALILSTLVMVVVSLMTQPPSDSEEKISVAKGLA